MMNWKNKKLGILGMGESGIGAAKLAMRLGAAVYCFDSNSEAPQLNGCHCRYGENADLDESIDTLIVSPGIPTENRLVRQAVEKGMEIVGELGFASQFIDLPMLAITGTNGKSSTAHYLHQLLAQAGKKPFIGGNFGRSLSDLAYRQTEFDIAVVEVSSYQMERPGQFAPFVAAALNLTPDHLARHKTMETYGEMKQRIFAQQRPNQFSLFPVKDKRLSPTGQGQKLHLGGNPGYRRRDGLIELKGTPCDGIYNLAAPLLLGEHNQDNLAAAFLMCICAGINPKHLSMDKITPLEHRLETVPSTDGIRWVNDSKATNVEAALAGIVGAPEPQIVLLGGQGKNNANYDILLNALKSRAKQVICFGASGKEIATALKALSPTVVDSMERAIAEARRIATQKDTVLLSPACASFDAYQNFKARGDAFKRIVSQMEER